MMIKQSKEQPRGVGRAGRETTQKLKAYSSISHNTDLLKRLIYTFVCSPCLAARCLLYTLRRVLLALLRAARVELALSSQLKIL